MTIPQLPTLYTLKDAIEILRNEYGGTADLADAVDIDRTYLHRLWKGEKDNPSDEILEALGLQKVTYYTIKS